MSQAARKEHAVRLELVMTLLDRFRAQPRQKHTDPAVRLAFVQEIPIDERDLLAEIACADPDGRIRRAAVAKLMDPAALASVVSGDADENVRNEALAMLRDIALEAFEGVTEAVSLAAVDAVTDAKTLGLVARRAPRAAVAARALSRITDARGLGSIARQAQLESIRRAAFDALRDRAEIVAVAMNGEFKDTAVAAVERLIGTGELEQIAARAKNKSAAKRARGLLLEMEERAGAEAAAAAPSSGAGDTPPQIGPGPDEALLAARRAEAADRERAEAEAARQRDEERAAERRRQEQAEEQARQKDAERRRGRLMELSHEAEAAAADEDLASARRRFGVIGLEWRDLSAGMTIDSDIANRYAAADSRLAARDAEAQEQDARTRHEALARLRQLLSRVEPLVARADVSLKVGDRALRDIRAALGAVPQLPSKQDYDDVVSRLKAVQAALTPKMEELRDMTEWQRWANAGIQEQLCEKMEALGVVEDPEEIARQVRQLQEQWRRAADVPRARGEALWRRFKAAHDEVWGRCEAQFAAQAVARRENLAKKGVLCERAEALADSTRWIQTAEEIKRLQAEWKTIGQVTRGQEKAIWERFRSACDRFFTRRHADLVDRKKLWAENLAKKDALCAKVEALADSTDWDVAAAAIRQLQAEWKTIGPVKKNRAEAIWQRFRAACDRFLSRYAQRHDIARAERVAAREAICADLESLGRGDGTKEPPADLVAKVRALRARWHQEMAARGVDRERAVALDERFHAAFTAVLSRWPSVFAGTDLDPESNRKRMETLVRRMEEIALSLGPSPADGIGGALSSPTRLAAMLKEALAANTIGGKVDEETRRRSAAEEVHHAQSAWSRIGPTPDDVRRALHDRFQRACRHITERAGRQQRSA